VKIPSVIARTRLDWLALASMALAALLASPPARADAPAAPQPTGHWREASFPEYRKHLEDLTTLVGLCAKSRDTRNCDPTLVGQDERVPLSNAPNAERRLVRFGWLRVLLSKAEDKDQAPEKAQEKPGAGKASEDENVRPARPSTSTLLKDAQARLTQDIAQADLVQAGRAQTSGAAPAAPAHPQEREAMKQVLAGHDFRNLQEPTARDSALERLSNWLNRLFDSAARLQAKSAWVGRAIVWGFIVAVCVALVWALLQLERRWRVRLTPEGGGPAESAASARDWQLWLEDARRAASAGQWREAIHFAYWASISRLESRRLWPADRARTPREYLALVAPEDPRKVGLAALTGSFERTWYGGRAAGESDYRRAEELAAELIAGSRAASAAEGGAG
jgi:hypothetical protein